MVVGSANCFGCSSKGLKYGSGDEEDENNASIKIANSVGLNREQEGDER